MGPKRFAESRLQVAFTPGPSHAQHLLPLPLTLPRLLKLLAAGVDPKQYGGSLYFSHAGDITLTAQRAERVAADPQTAAARAWQRADLDVTWNAALARPLLGGCAVARFLLGGCLGAADEGVQSGSQQAQVLAELDRGSGDAEALNLCQPLHIAQWCVCSHHPVCWRLPYM